MTDNDTQTAAGSPDVATDDGSVTSSPSDEDVDYLDAEVHLLKPSTPFMRDHLKVVWTMFLAWAVVVFGPVTATYLATDVLTSTTFLGFPLHYFLTAVGAPSGALLLSLVYARTRDRLDARYGIDHSTTSQAAEPGTATTDGGVEE